MFDLNGTVLVSLNYNNCRLKFKIKQTFSFLFQFDCSQFCVDFASVEVLSGFVIESGS